MRIAMLLQEMSVKQRCNKDAGGKPRVLPVLQFSRGDYGEIEGAVPLAVEDLLATWPSTVPEKIERGLCNLINSVRHSTVPGTDISLDQHVNRPFLFFADNRQTFDYFVNAMVDYHWLKQHYAANGLVSGCRQVCVTPEGWRKYDELTRTEGSAKNPVFVAMWFGGDKQQKEMLSLFEGALEPAINDAGYHAKRADTDEHNEQIIDRIVTDIRRAPFVVAELTDNNPGVYYEAGLAQGQNKTVIYCAPRGHEEAHFDVRGYPK
ncbi:MAG: hypothetical protein IIB60_05095 [Planctomycetes bacterium]|nr:hypothetical protein [Planctomycetota bacterium]